MGNYKDAEERIAEIDNIMIKAKYDSAVQLMDEQKYLKAIEAFDELDGYMNSSDLIQECNYMYAVQLMKDKKYEEAIVVFENSDGYMDSLKLLEECKLQKQYSIYPDNILELILNGKYEEVYNMLIIDGNDEQLSHFILAYTRSSYVGSTDEYVCEYIYDMNGNLLKEEKSIPAERKESLSVHMMKTIVSQIK